VERVERPIRLLEPPPVAIAPPPAPPPPSTPPRRREPPPVQAPPPPSAPPLRSPAEVDALISEVLPPQSDAHGADPPETACFDALGCVWVLPDDWRGARPIDLPALTRRELSRVLADPVSFCNWNPCASE
jgi:hypothetical protein